MGKLTALHLTLIAFDINFATDKNPVQEFLCPLSKNHDKYLCMDALILLVAHAQILDKFLDNEPLLLASGSVANIQLQIQKHR